MDTKHIAIISSAAVAVAALIGAGTAVAIRRRNRVAAEAETVETTETTGTTEALETPEESVAAGAAAFLSEQPSPMGS